MSNTNPEVAKSGAEPISVAEFKSGAELRWVASDSIFRQRQLATLSAILCPSNRGYVMHDGSPGFESTTARAFFFVFTVCTAEAGHARCLPFINN